MSFENLKWREMLNIDSGFFLPPQSIPIITFRRQVYATVVLFLKLPSALSHCLWYAMGFNPIISELLPSRGGRINVKIN